MSDFPQVEAGTLPWLTVEQMAEADRVAVEDFGIDLLQMMEHAGAALAEVVMRLVPDGAVTVLAGGGNNGGGGLCAARHLHDRGRDVEVVLASGAPGPAAAHHLRTLAAAGIQPVPEPDDRPVAVDALVGYGLAGPLRKRAAELATWSAGRFVVSLDLPSGHGHPGAIRPAATVTLALPKQSLAGVRPLYLVDLGLPPELWSRPTLGLQVGPVFAPGRILEVV